MEIGVYGLGRFGTFWAKQLSRYHTVKGYNRSPKNSLDFPIELVSEEEVLNCEAVMLCVTIDSLEAVLKRISPLLAKGCTVIDTCSVKVYPSLLMEKLLPPQINIIATHPMFGPDSGKHGIKGLPLVYCPIRGSQELFATWEKVFANMELNVLPMSCDDHDKEAAYSQGVTHFVGRVLDQLQLKKTELATVGYTNLLAIVEQTCNDPLQLFYDLQRYNPYAKQMHLQLQQALDHVLHILQEQDEKGLKLP
ncbi:MAG: prephenate dehydrogenase/arogenate dehydrogenase family protein [Sphaerochaetaceae bacterium]